MRTTQPIKDYRWHRFDAADPGAYDEEEEDVWQAIAQYEAGFNPWIHRHPESDFPEPSIKRAMELARIIHDQDEVDDMTKGFIAADQRIPLADDQIDDWSTELRAGYLAREEGHRAGEVAGREDAQAGRPASIRDLGQAGADERG